MQYNFLVDDYPLHISTPLTVAETKYPYLSITERHMQAMWLEQKYFHNLKTSEGIPIIVISPGIWNSEAGPDFLKAHLKIGSIDLRGDIELHLSSDGWENHGHSTDPRYNNVILHLCFWQSKTRNSVVTSQDKPIFEAYLEDFLTIPLQRILKLIDLDLYPYQRFVGTGKCAENLFAKMPQPQTIDFFQSAAQWRLHQKFLNLEARVDTPELAFLAGIALALGYKHNTEAFFELFIRLNKLRHHPEDKLLALGIGLCGGFDKKGEKKWGTSEMYQKLRGLYGDHHQYPGRIGLILNHVRPYNHPFRRLVYLVKMIKDPQASATYTKMLDHWSEHWHKAAEKNQWPALRAQLQAMLPTYEDAYWNSHFLFELEPQQKNVALIGDDFRNNVLINTFMPLLYGKICSSKNTAESDGFLDFYMSFPAAKCQKSHYLTQRFFGNTSKGNLLNKAVLQQGAYQLHRDFCIHYEASCEGCSFVERYQSLDDDSN